ncbi:triose-phosphate isomerase [Patescibacteria group bacterium]|nr:triose-phosphate isomerase [Patescibacteria group bacterium]
MKKIIIANWKMNPLSLKEAKRIFNEIKRTARKMLKVETVVCPPFVYLQALRRTVLRRAAKDGPSLSLGAQDVFCENPPKVEGGGAHTGEISAKMLKNLGVKYVIVGHSERRDPPTGLPAQAGGGETNEIINKKIKAVLGAGMKVIFCVGEKERDEEGEYLRFIKDEINEGLKGVQKNFFNPPAGGLIFAYEPIWAISSNKGAHVDNPESALRIAIFIRRTIMEIADGQIARSVPILYGGSICPQNAEAFLKDGGMQGLLVGHESLNPKHFNEILKIANQI